MLPKSRLAGTKNYGAISRHFILGKTLSGDKKPNIDLIWEPQYLSRNIYQLIFNRTFNFKLILYVDS